ncbi:MAG: PD40 domain-containing protein, partial [Candidatus Aminicenantes bacterium]|nr:PD40 domain-containing protein [Candidatus Aminicenantes bacterium]
TAFQDGSHDIFKINLTTEKILNLTENDLYEKAPAISPDGKYVAYTIRIDTYDKLFLSPINNLNKKTQLTFGRGNTITPEFSSDSKEIFFSGDMREAFNIYSLNLETNELKRYTDVRTGNFFPIPLPNDPKKIIFSSFNKGAFQIFKSEFEGEVEKTITFAEIKAEEEFQRFEPIITIEINKDKIKTYKGLSKLYLTSRPPIDTIISTDGSIYGGSAISFKDLMGDHNFSFSAYQVRSFRSYYFAYMNLKRRLHYMASAFQRTMFYYTPYAYYDPTYYNYLTYRDAMATRKMTGLNIGIYYPLSKYYRTEAYLGFSHYEEEFYNQGMTGYGSFWNGNWLSASISITGETTRFNYYGPKTGNTFRLSITQGIPISGFLQNTTLQADFRQYLYIGADSLFAFRFNGFASRGKNPYVSYFGGNNQVRSANYYSIIATEGWY